MGSTSRYQWPYPEDGGPADVTNDMQQLATSLEETVGGIDDRLTTLTGLSQSVFQYTTLTRVSSSIMTIDDSAWSAVYFDAAQYNLPTSQPGWVFASPERITCQQTGLYRITGFAGFALNPTGTRGIAIRVNGNPSYAAIQSGVAPSDIEWYGNVYVEARVNKNDYLQLVVRQTSGAPLKLDTVQPRFSMQRLV